MTTTPDALLFVHSTCPHCPAILQALSELVKAGALGRLEVVNLSIHPEMAQSLGVRSVPWYRIGSFELQGLRSAEELRQWAEHARHGTGMAAYFDTLLQQQGIAKVEALLDTKPEYFSAVLELLGDPATAIQTRLGIGAILESHAGSGIWPHLVADLGRLSSHADQRIRADACHYLGLSGTPEAIPYLRACLQDSDADVREIAAESLAALQA